MKVNVGKCMSTLTLTSLDCGDPNALIKRTKKSAKIFFDQVIVRSVNLKASDSGF